MKKVKQQLEKAQRSPAWHRLIVTIKATNVKLLPKQVVQTLSWISYSAHLLFPPQQDRWILILSGRDNKRATTVNTASVTVQLGVISAKRHGNSFYDGCAARNKERWGESSQNTAASSRSHMSPMYSYHTLKITFNLPTWFKQTVPLLSTQWAPWIQPAS